DSDAHKPLAWTAGRKKSGHDDIAASVAEANAEAVAAASATSEGVDESEKPKKGAGRHASLDESDSPAAALATASASAESEVGSSDSNAHKPLEWIEGGKKGGHYGSAASVAEASAEANAEAIAAASATSGGVDESKKSKKGHGPHASLDERDSAAVAVAAVSAVAAASASADSEVGSSDSDAHKPFGWIKGGKKGKQDDIAASVAKANAEAVFAASATSKGVEESEKRKKSPGLHASMDESDSSAATVAAASAVAGSAVDSSRGDKSLPTGWLMKENNVRSHSRVIPVYESEEDTIADVGVTSYTQDRREALGDSLPDNTSIDSKYSSAHKHGPSAQADKRRKGTGAANAASVVETYAGAIAEAGSTSHDSEDGVKLKKVPKYHALLDGSDSATAASAVASAISDSKVGDDNGDRRKPARWIAGGNEVRHGDKSEFVAEANAGAVAEASAKSQSTGENVKLNTVPKDHVSLSDNDSDAAASAAGNADSKIGDSSGDKHRPSERIGIEKKVAHDYHAGLNKKPEGLSIAKPPCSDIAVIDRGTIEKDNKKASDWEIDGFTALDHTGFILRAPPPTSIVKKDSIKGGDGETMIKEASSSVADKVEPHPITENTESITNPKLKEKYGKKYDDSVVVSGPSNSAIVKSKPYSSSKDKDDNSLLSNKDAKHNVDALPHEKPNQVEDSSKKVTEPCESTIKGIDALDHKDLMPGAKETAEANSPPVSLYKYIRSKGKAKDNKAERSKLAKPDSEKVLRTDNDKPDDQNNSGKAKNDNNLTIDTKAPGCAKTGLDSAPTSKNKNEQDKWKLKNTNEADGVITKKIENDSPSISSWKEKDDTKKGKDTNTDSLVDKEVHNVDKISNDFKEDGWFIKWKLNDYSLPITAINKAGAREISHRVEPIISSTTWTDTSMEKGSSGKIESGEEADLIVMRKQYGHHKPLSITYIKNSIRPMVLYRKIPKSVYEQVLYGSTYFPFAYFIFHKIIAHLMQAWYATEK
ncbi:hypothetical protein KPH14_003233, partial [Odynerus spinipes]